uniref:Uncharacterized protein n=1 Tax=Romanomermis culicivorax TaxID=13658 RepID=A0A915IJD8_ROMCU
MSWIISLGVSRAAAVIVCRSAGGGWGLPWINIDEGFGRVSSGDGLIIATLSGGAWQQYLRYGWRVRTNDGGNERGIITFCITLGATRILKLSGVFRCKAMAGKERVQSKQSPALCLYLRRMDLIYYISTVILVSIIHGQTIPCHLPDQEKFIFVEGSVGKICDPKRPGQLKALPKGNKLSADQCTHILDGKLYRVLQKKVTDHIYIQWRFCGSGNKFDRQNARTGQDCDKLTRKMRNKYREIFKQMFIYSSESCDLNKLIPSPGMEKTIK